jgi:hypothetical protein
MAVNRNNHVVSAGYLRYFTKDGRRIRLFAVDGSLDVVAPVRKVFREYDFSVVRAVGGPVDELEAEWSRLEDFALPKLRGLSLGAPLSTDEDAAIKILVALHFARSYGLDAAFRETWECHLAAMLKRLEGDQALESAFREDFGRQAGQGEAVRLAGELVEERAATNAFFVQTQSEHYNKMLTILRPLNTQLGYARAGGKQWFVTSDSPVVMCRDADSRAPGRGVPVEQANAFLMPLTKNVVASFTTRTDQLLHVDLNGEGIRQVNERVRAAALRFVVAHPETALVVCAPGLVDADPAT